MQEEASKRSSLTEKCLEEIHPGEVERIIDKPMQCIRESWNSPVLDTASHDAILNALVEYYQYLQKEWLPGSPRMPWPLAAGPVRQFLDTCDKRIRMKFRSSVDVNDCFQGLLDLLTESEIRAATRQYLAHQFRTAGDALDYEFMLGFTRRYIEYYGPYLPFKSSKHTPSWLMLPGNLLMAHLGIVEFYRKSLLFRIQFPVGGAVMQEGVTDG